MNTSRNQPYQATRRFDAIKHLEQRFDDLYHDKSDDQTFSEIASEVVDAAGEVIFSLINDADEEIPAQLKDLPRIYRHPLIVTKKGESSPGVPDAYEVCCFGLYWFRFVLWYIDSTSGANTLGLPQKLSPLRHAVERLPAETLDRHIQEACPKNILDSDDACGPWVGEVWRSLASISRTICREYELREENRIGPKSPDLSAKQVLEHLFKIGATSADALRHMTRQDRPTQASIHRLLNCVPKDDTNRVNPSGQTKRVLKQLRNKNFISNGRQCGSDTPDGYFLTKAGLHHLNK